MKLTFDTRWIAAHGIGRVASEYYGRLRSDFDVDTLPIESSPSSPMDWLATRDLVRCGDRVFFSPGYNGSPFAKRQVFMIHDLIHMEAREPGSLAKRVYYNLILRSAAQKSHLVTVSKASRDAILAIWPELRDRIHVIYNGVSASFRTSRQIGERNGIILFANDRWHKNLDRALAGIVQASSASTVVAAQTIRVIGGDNATKEKIAAALGTRVIYCGKVSDCELATIYSSSSATLFCSLYEGFGLPLVESSACGCPVVASDIGVFRELNIPGIYIDPNDVNAIASGLCTAIAEPPALVPDDIADQFNWDRSYVKLRDLLLQV